MCFPTIVRLIDYLPNRFLVGAWWICLAEELEGLHGVGGAGYDGEHSAERGEVERCAVGGACNHAAADVVGLER